MSIRALPQQFGDLTSLEDLDMQDCRFVVSLPASFCRLSKLKKLNLSHCKNLGTILPEGWSKQPGYYYHMASGELTWDAPQGTQYMALPEGFGELDLEELNLGGCEALAMDTEINKIVEMKNLKKLLIWRTNISVLPKRFGDLSSLEDLNMSHCTSVVSSSKSICGIIRATAS